MTCSHTPHTPDAVKLGPAALVNRRARKEWFGSNTIHDSSVFARSRARAGPSTPNCAQGLVEGIKGHIPVVAACSCEQERRRSSSRWVPSSSRSKTRNSARSHCFFSAHPASTLGAAGLRLGISHEPQHSRSLPPQVFSPFGLVFRVEDCGEALKLRPSTEHTKFHIYKCIKSLLTPKTSRDLIQTQSAWIAH